MNRYRYFRIAASLAFILGLAVVLMPAFGCGTRHHAADNSSGLHAADDDSTRDDDSASGDDTEELTMTITWHRIPSSASPANPVTHNTAPDDFNKAAFTRYRLTAHGEDLPIRAVLIAEGGFMGGANNFHYMAQRLVKSANGWLEVWAVDRLPNMLEDLTGEEAAEREHNPDLVYDYYLDGKPVDGRTFQGFLSNRDADYLSEWGITAAVDDLAAMIDLVPKNLQKTHVFLAGHSLGGLAIENFAAWDFDGNPDTTDDAGFNRIAGLALIDGSVTDFSSITWLWGLADLFTSTGNLGYEAALSTVRAVGPRYFSLPIMQRIMAQIEGWGMAADWDPDGMSDAWDRSEDIRVGLALMYAGTGQISMTNAALLGIILDNDFQWISAMDSSFGKLVGPTWQRKAPVPVFKADLDKQYQVPDGPGPFGWKNSVEYESGGEDEATDMHSLARATYEGKTNWIEWYFTTRFVLDLVFNNDLDVSPGSTDARWREGIRAVHAASCDMPVIGFGTAYGFLPDEAAFDKYRGMLPPVRGSNGASRMDEGFDIHLLPGYSHHDPMLAGTAKKPNLMFGPLLDWMDRWAGEETFVIPAIPQVSD